MLVSGAGKQPRLHISAIIAIWLFGGFTQAHAQGVCDKNDNYTDCEHSLVDAALERRDFGAAMFHLGILSEENTKERTSPPIQYEQIRDEISKLARAAETSREQLAQKDERVAALQHELANAQTALKTQSSHSKDPVIARMLAGVLVTGVATVGSFVWYMIEQKSANSAYQQYLAVDSSDKTSADKTWAETEKARDRRDLANHVTYIFGGVAVAMSAVTLVYWLLSETGGERGRRTSANFRVMASPSGIAAAASF